MQQYPNLLLHGVFFVLPVIIRRKLVINFSAAIIRYEQNIIVGITIDCPAAICFDLKDMNGQLVRTNVICRKANDPRDR